MKVCYSNPYSRIKNIGRALNEFCAMVPTDSWIVLQDGDIMYLTDYWGTQIEDIIANNQNYDLIGCVTNRLKHNHQLYLGKFSEDPDILNHIAIAEKVSQDHYDTVEQTEKAIAGMCMLFPKKIWTKHQFKENTPTFDTHFSRSIQRAGGKVGIAKGLYVFHRYRMGKPDPKTNDKHLK